MKHCLTCLHQHHHHHHIHIHNGTRDDPARTCPRNALRPRLPLPGRRQRRLPTPAAPKPKPGIRVCLHRRHFCKYTMPASHPSHTMLVVPVPHIPVPSEYDTSSRILPTPSRGGRGASGPSNPSPRGLLFPISNALRFLSARFRSSWPCSRWYPDCRWYRPCSRPSPRR